MEKRDLKADLELCEKTKPISDETKKFLITRMARSNMKSSESTWLILEAIDGWPHAIERALEAEKRVEELENQVDILSTTLNMYCSPYYREKERADKLKDVVQKSVEVANRTKVLLKQLTDCYDLMVHLKPIGSLQMSIHFLLDSVKDVLDDE